MTLREKVEAWIAANRERAESMSDEEARALVFVREVGAVDNAAYRSINRVDTLSASVHLRRLRDLELLEMKGAGNRSYYVVGAAMVRAEARGHAAEPDQPAAERHQVATDPHHPSADPHQLSADPHHPVADPHQVPAPIAARIAAAGTRPRRPILRAPRRSGGPVTLREKVEAWIAANRERAESMSCNAIAREVGGDPRNARRFAAQALSRGDAPMTHGTRPADGRA